MSGEQTIVVADDGDDLGPVLRLDFTGGTVSRVGITATISVSGSSGGSIFTEPSASADEDDLFNASSLDAKWTEWGTGQTADLATIPGWLRQGTLTKTAGAYDVQVVGWVQPMPVSWSHVETEVLVGEMDYVFYHQAGLMLTNGTSKAAGSAAWFYQGMNNGVNIWRFGAEKLVNGVKTADVLAEVSGSMRELHHGFQKIKRVSATEFEFFLSTTGKSWAYVGAATLDFTPTHFGINAGVAGSAFNYFVVR